MDRRSITSKENGKKHKKASHTLEAQEAKAILIAKIHEKIEPLADILIQRALKGDIAALKEVFDRGFGKAMQAIEMSGKDGKELFTPTEKIKELAKELNEIYRRGITPSN